MHRIAAFSSSVLFTSGLGVLAMEPDKIAAWLACAGSVAGAFLVLARAIAAASAERTKLVDALKATGEQLEAVLERLNAGDAEFKKFGERMAKLEARCDERHKALRVVT